MQCDVKKNMNLQALRVRHTKFEGTKSKSGVLVSGPLVSNSVANCLNNSAENFHGQRQVRVRTRQVSIFLVRLLASQSEVRDVEVHELGGL